MKRNALLLTASAFVLASCAGNSGKALGMDGFAGVWHETMPEDMNVIQGFVLEKDGTAASVGMATLQYSKWKLVGNRSGGQSIVMEGESIGNGRTIRFADTMDVVSFVQDTLVLGRGESFRLKYVRQSPVYESAPDVIMAEFTGCDGEMLTAEFNSGEGTVTVTFEGREYVLGQYVTASGYGYADSVIDMRGKGKDMQLTFKESGRTVNFTEK